MFLLALVTDESLTHLIPSVCAPVQKLQENVNMHSNKSLLVVCLYLGKITFIT